MMLLFFLLLGIFCVVHGALWTPWNPRDIGTSSDQSTTFLPVVMKTVKRTPESSTPEQYRSQEELQILRQLAGKLCEDKEKCLKIFVDTLTDRKYDGDLNVLLRNNRQLQKKINSTVKREKNIREFMVNVRQSKVRIRETAKIVWREFSELFEKDEYAKEVVVSYVEENVDMLVQLFLRLPDMLARFSQGETSFLFLAVSYLPFEVYGPSTPSMTQLFFYLILERYPVN